jgi:hypothetical protein
MIIQAVSPQHFRGAIQRRQKIKVIRIGLRIWQTIESVVTFFKSVI